MVTVDIINALVVDANPEHLPVEFIARAKLTLLTGDEIVLTGDEFMAYIHNRRHEVHSYRVAYNVRVIYETVRMTSDAIINSVFG